MTPPNFDPDPDFLKRTQGSKRTVRGIGTFDQGAQRTVEYQLHLNF